MKIKQLIGCAGKVAFDDRARAEKAAARRVGRKVYKCEFCHEYHVGTDDKRSLLHRRQNRKP